MTPVNNPKIKPLILDFDEGCTSDVRHFMLVWWNLTRGVEVLKCTSSLRKFDIDDPPAWRVFFDRNRQFRREGGAEWFFFSFCNPVSGFWSSAPLRCLRSQPFAMGSVNEEAVA